MLFHPLVDDSDVHDEFGYHDALENPFHVYDLDDHDVFYINQVDSITRLKEVDSQFHKNNIIPKPVYWDEVSNKLYSHFFET